MPRRKSGPSTAKKEAVAATTNTTTTSATTTPKSHKRQLSETPVTATTTGSRASKRIRESAEKAKISKVTPTKSRYFQDNEDDDSEDVSDSNGDDEDDESGYEEDEDGQDEASSDGPEDDEDDYDSEEEEESKRPSKKQGGGSNKKSTAASGAAIVSAVLEKGKELWRPGVKTGLGPGKQVFIEKPKPRGDGGVAYVPDKIHPNTMAFLADLKRNNDREWLKMHDPDYRQSWKDWESFVETLTEKISELDETVPELPPKDLVFRIYRDIRFSSDPTPYKPHFAAAWSRTGRKGPYACYYVHIEPGGKSLVGSGLWMPEAQPLSLLRTNIDRKPRRLRRILNDPRMRKHILGVSQNDEKKAIKAFVDQNKENALKTKPKGYDADNPNIELLRLRNFTLGKRIPDEMVMGEQGLRSMLDLIGVLVPFVTYLNSVVMPDEDESSGDEADSS